MNFRIFLIALLGITGAQSHALTLSLEGAADYAVKNNPTLAAARLRIAEAQGRLAQSGRIKNPELETELARNPQKPEGKWSVSFLQKFPVTARLRLEKQVNRAALAAAEAEVRNEERKLAAETRVAAVQQVALREQRALREKQLANFQELSEFLNKRVKTGEASSMDALQVQLETQRIEAEQLQLDVDEANARGELQILLGADPDAGINITGQLAFNDTRLRSGNLEDRPDLLAAKQTAEAARQQVDLARAEKWEDISVGFGFEHERSEDAPDGFERDSMIGLRFIVPLPLWNQNQGRIEETKATAARTEKEVAALAMRIRSETKAARQKVVALAKVLHQLDETLLPQAAKSEELVRSNYDTGLTSLAEVLRARDRRLQMERQRLDTLRDYQIAIIRHRSALSSRP